MGIVAALREAGHRARWAWFRGRLFVHWLNDPSPVGDPMLGRTAEEQERNARLLGERHAAREPRPPRRMRVQR